MHQASDLPLHFSLIMFPNLLCLLASQDAPKFRNRKIEICNGLKYSITDQKRFSVTSFEQLPEELVSRVIFVACFLFFFFYQGSPHIFLVALEVERFLDALKVPTNSELRIIQLFAFSAWRMG